MEIRGIEKFFLNTLLIISIGGIFLVLVSNIVLFPEDILSIWISSTLLAACTLAYLLRNKYPTTSVLTVTSIALLAMTYQRLTAPFTTTSLSIVLIVGFILSVMLKGRKMWIMHSIAFAIINTVFIYDLPDAITAAITYSTLYFVLSYATAVLKSSYDRIHVNLKSTNIQLNEKAKEIEEQNQKLIEAHDSLNQMNKDLEKIVNERTAKIQEQNKILIKYSYTNAHHLRGPVARLLGLASVYKLDSDNNPHLFIDKMAAQAKEIDDVIKQITIDIEKNDTLFKN